jgi:geranylgeranyl diphosphate synthase type II
MVSTIARSLEPPAETDELERRIAACRAAVVGQMGQSVERVGPPLAEPLAYALLPGGKLLRSTLCLIVAEALGLECRVALPTAAAIEMIHTMSLVHDDLPAMDGASTRRGRPTLHLRYDEATAILVGDALLTMAFAEIAATPDLPGDRLVRVMATLADAAGPHGLAGGQAVDLEVRGERDLSVAALEQLAIAKTGVLFSAAVVCGAQLAGGSDALLEGLREYALRLGVLFQITDDLLDVTGDAAHIGKDVGLDQRNEHPTFCAVLGVEGARARAAEVASEARAALQATGQADALWHLAHLAARVEARAA